MVNICNKKKTTFRIELNKDEFLDSKVVRLQKGFCCLNK